MDKTRGSRVHNTKSFLKRNLSDHVVANHENWGENVTRWRPHGEKREACEDRNNDLKITAVLNWYQFAQERKQ